MWGRDGVRVFTLDDGWGWIFAAVEHWNAECVGCHVCKVGSRFAALDPIAQGLERRYGSLDADVARGLALRMDHGSQYLFEVLAIGSRSEKRRKRKMGSSTVSPASRSKSLCVVCGELFVLRRTGQACCCVRTRAPGRSVVPTGEEPAATSGAGGDTGRREPGGPGATRGGGCYGWTASALRVCNAKRPLSTTAMLPYVTNERMRKISPATGLSL